MFRYLLIALPGLVLSFGSFAAFAELPSLMPDRPAHPEAVRAEQRRSFSPLPRGLATLQRGRLSTNFGVLHYRVGGEGLTASFRYRAAAASAVIGYEGERRLEIDWRSGGRNVTFAIATTEHDGGYRLEIMRDF